MFLKIFLSGMLENLSLVCCQGSDVYFEIIIPYHHTPFYRLVQFQEFLLKLKKHSKTCKTAPIKVCNEVGDDDEDVEDNDKRRNDCRSISAFFPSSISKVLVKTFKENIRRVIFKSVLTMMIKMLKTMIWRKRLQERLINGEHGNPLSLTAE